MEDRQSIDTGMEFDLENWGLQHVASLRRAEVDGVRGFAICSASGQMIGFSVNRNQAIGAIVQNDLEPVSVH